MAESINFDEEDNGLPALPAREQAQDEREDIEPGPADVLSFNEDGAATQTGEDPVYDAVGRSDSD